MASGGVIYPKIDIITMHRIVDSPVFCHTSVISQYHKLEDDALGFSINGLCREKPGILVNPQLASVNFYKKFDAFQAFQMLERFIANDLAPKDERKDKPIPDKLKAESHGFNKMSFRKEPSKSR